MSDLPLPEPDLRTDTDVYPHGRHAYSGAQCVRYAAAKTAALEAECASEKANNDAMVDCCDALDKKCRQLEAECARLRAAYLQQSKEFGYELRDPNGTIWDECRRLQAALDAALRGKETP